MFLTAVSLRQSSLQWVRTLGEKAGISTLVVAEHTNGKVSPTTLSAITAASQLQGGLSVVLSGAGASAGANIVRDIKGVEKVLVAEHDVLQYQIAEPMSRLLQHLQNRRSFTHILAPSSSFGKNLLPRAAALLNCQPVSDVVQILDADTYVRPIYAGNALATVKYTQPGLRMLTIRPTAFPPASGQPEKPAQVEAISADELQAAAAETIKVEWVREALAKSERPELGAAKVVVSGGRALKSAENFKMLEELADLLGGAVGASRAAVDAGYVANDLQVGQTGKVVAPNLYIGIGISGAIQHLAGMKDSRTIVAINTDAEAPIFQVADYGLVQDCFTAVPELIAAVKKLKAES